MTFIQTYSTLTYDFENPKVSMIDQEDIIKGLSNINRFVGHTHKPVSVLQHSLIVASLCPKHKLIALLHDATEAYLGDVSKPLKNLLGERYKFYEIKCWEVICQRFNIDNLIIPDEVHTADNHALWLEAIYYHGANFYNLEYTSPESLIQQYTHEKDHFNFHDNWIEAFRSKQLPQKHHLYAHFNKEALIHHYRESLRTAHQEYLSKRGNHD